MIVADLKQHLADLAKLLDSTGGKQVAKDLAVMAEGLTPFALQSMAEFSRLLSLAHEYQTTGKLSAPVKAARSAQSPKAKADPTEIAADIRRLYDQSGDLSLTMEQIHAGLGRLDELTKVGLLTVCSRMELAGQKAKKIDDIRKAIRQKVLDRRSSAQREQMIQPSLARDESVSDIARP